jgi:transcriptional regulator with XRE-family HTH domain
MPETTGERIRARRKELELSQDTVAEAVGVSAGAVSQWELGLVDVLGRNLVKLAATLDTTPEWLLGEPQSSRSSELDVIQLERAMGLVESLPKNQLSKLSLGQRAKLVAYLYGQALEKLTGQDIEKLLVLVQ